MHTFMRLTAVLSCVAAPGMARADEPAPPRHFLTIQVTEYGKNTTFTQQRAPQRDAATFSAAFGESRWKGIHVHLSDAPGQSTSARPTAAGIRTAFDALARDSRIGSDDECIVYLSGTGFESPAGAVFCPSGADLKNPDSLILIDELKQRLRLVPGRRKLLIVEACRNPIDAKVTLHAPEARKTDSETRPAGLSKPGAFVVIQAASKGQYAYNCQKSGFGIMTCQLLEALKSPEVARNGEVTAAGVASYLKRTVPKLSADVYSAEQVPLISDESGVDWVLAKVEKAPSEPAPRPIVPAPAPAVPSPGAGAAVLPRPPAPIGYAPAPVPAQRPAPPAQQNYPVMRQAANQAIRYGFSKIK